MNRLLLAGLLAVAPTLAAPASDRTGGTSPKTLASFPNGTFLENLTVAADGSVIFTSYFGKSLLRLKDGELQAPFALLDVHPVGIIGVADGFVMTAHGKAFTDAPAFLSTNKVMLLSKSGTVKQVVDVPEAQFLNGLVALSPKRILMADSVKGMIWAFDPSTGALTTWLADEQLTLDPTIQPFRPAANGLKIYKNALYVSNSSRGTMYRVQLDAKGNAAGKPELLIKSGPVDDFAIDADGSIYASTHGDSLLRILPDGSQTALLKEGCDGCTSVAIIGKKPRRSVLVLTTGKFAEGGKLPAKVLQVDLE
jgi:hypothetical protein